LPREAYTNAKAACQRVQIESQRRKPRRGPVKILQEEAQPSAISGLLKTKMSSHVLEEPTRKKVWPRKFEKLRTEHELPDKLQDMVKNNPIKIHLVNQSQHRIHRASTLYMTISRNSSAIRGQPKD